MKITVAKELIRKKDLLSGLYQKKKSMSNINVNSEAKNKGPNRDRYIRISFLQWLSVVKKTVWIPRLGLKNKINKRITNLFYKMSNKKLLARTFLL